MYITEYQMVLEQSMNLAVLYRQGDFSYTDAKDKKEDMLNEIKMFQKEGRL